MPHGPQHYPLVDKGMGYRRLTNEAIAAASRGFKHQQLVRSDSTYTEWYLIGTVYFTAFELGSVFCMYIQAVTSNMLRR